MTTLYDARTRASMTLPDWTGETVVIIASGPSAAAAPVDMVKGRAKVITINNSWRLAPWSDILFAVDWRWWKAHRGVPDFHGVKLTIDWRFRHRKEWDIWSLVCPKVENDEIVHRPGHVAWGGNSGMGALNLADQLGASKIILVGYDMHLMNGAHWHGDHVGSGLTNPTSDGIIRWRRAINRAAHKLRARVINASEASALTAYPKMPLEKALEC